MMCSLRQRLDTLRSRGDAGLVWTLLLFLLALAPRLPGLRLFLTSDEQTNLYWAGSQFVEGLLRGDLSLTYWHFYPGVTMSWVEASGLTVAWALARLTGGTAETLAQFVRRPILDLIVAARLPYALLTAGGVAGFYLLARRLLGHRTALLGALFLAFDPFYLAHSRVAHADAAVAVFMGLSALAFFVYLRERSPQGERNQRVSVHPLPLVGGGLGRGWRERRKNTLRPGQNPSPAEIPPSPGPSLSGRGERFRQWINPLNPLTKQGRRWLILSAVMGALAALTKAPGQLVAPFVVLVAAGDWLLRSWRLRRLDRPASLWDRRLARRRLADLALWGIIAAALFVVLWPAMWVDPVGTVTRMLNETFGKVEAGHLVYFMGQPTLDPGPWFYPYVIPFRLTPITLIGVLASGVLILGEFCRQTLFQSRERGHPEPVEGASASTLRQAPWPARRSQDRYVAAALLWLFVIVLLLFGDLSPKKQDRYLLPLFPFLDLLAAFAWVQIGKWAYAIRNTQSHNTQSRNTQSPISNLQPIILSALLLAHTLPALTAYPYYLAYFNPLMGGLPRAVETTLVGWGEGMEQAAYYLNKKPGAESLTVAATPSQTLLPYFVGTGENFYTNDVALRADYVVLYVAQVQRLAPSPEIVRYFRAMEPEHIVTVRGVPYAWIYPGPKLITRDLPPDAAPANVGFGDQLRLAGYQMANGQMANGKWQITLYWHALAPMETDYTVSVRLVAPDGTRVAQHDSWPVGGLLPTTQWRPGDYVRDEHPLTPPADAPPGDYTVQVVVYDAASGAALSEPVTVASVPLP